jgi:transposase
MRANLTRCAVLYVLENGCKWRVLPERFGNWHTIYIRMNRWVKAGVWARWFEALQHQNIIAIDVRVLSLESTCAKVHPDACEALRKPTLKPLQPHEAGARTPITFRALL